MRQRRRASRGRSTDATGFTRMSERRSAADIKELSKFRWRLSVRGEYPLLRFAAT
jgi:hypothetical protein